MRIVHYQQHFLGPDSGTANAARGWAEALARTGADVSALVDRSIAERPAPIGVEVVGLEHSLRGLSGSPAASREHWKAPTSWFSTAVGFSGTSWWGGLASANACHSSSPAMVSTRPRCSRRREPRNAFGPRPSSAHICGGRSPCTCSSLSKLPTSSA